MAGEIREHRLEAYTSALHESMQREAKLFRRIIRRDRQERQVDYRLDCALAIVVGFWLGVLACVVSLLLLR